MDYAVRARAVDEVRSLVADGERIVVLGGSGWFGRTVLALLIESLGTEVLDRTLVGGQATRTFDLLGVPVQTAQLTSARITEFGPAHLINCAFPTRNKVAPLGESSYRQACTDITDLWIESLKLSSLRSAVTFSSGAAVENPASFEGDPDPANIYGEMKRAEEERTLAAAEHVSVDPTIARVWSVSGCHVQEVAAYAFSALIAERINSGLAVARSRTEVWRRYSLIEDVIAVAWRSSANCISPLFDSAGDLVEVHQLAAMINGDSLRVQLESSTLASGYFSDADEFDSLARSISYPWATLAEQVDLVQRFGRKHWLRGSSFLRVGAPFGV